MLLFSALHLEGSQLMSSRGAGVRHGQRDESRRGARGRGRGTLHVFKCGSDVHRHLAEPSHTDGHARLSHHRGGQLRPQVTLGCFTLNLRPCNLEFPSIIGQ